MEGVVGAIPWYRSTIVVGVLVSLVSKALVVSGIIPDLSNDEEAQITTLLVTLAGVAGDAIALFARFKQQHAPVIKSSKASAALIPPKIVVDAGVDAALAAEDVEVPSWMR